MKNFKTIQKFFALLSSLLLISSLQAADTTVMTSFVKEAKEYANSVGKEQALAEFNKTKGKFVRGDLYIFAYDFSGTVMAHGAKPALVGKNLIAIKDKKGFALIKEMIKVAEKNGEGEVIYYWPHPAKNKVMRKVGYVMKVDDSYWIGSGVYSDN